MSPIARKARALIRGLILVTTAASAVVVLAQPSAVVFPDKPVRFIVPFPPGGPNDVLARSVGQKLAEGWGQPVVIENKPGAGSIIGIDAVAKAKPDGHAIGIVASSFVVNPSLHPKMPYDTLKDLRGVTQLAVAEIYLLANPSLPANNVRELIALAKASPGSLSYGSVGTGSTAHLPGEMLKTAAGIDILHVPYKGTNPATVDLLSGRVQLMFHVLATQTAHIRSGKLKVLAVASQRRSAVFPDVPTVAETLPGFEASTLFGVVAPSGTPSTIVHKLNADMVRVLGTQEMKTLLSGLDLEPVGSTPEQFDALIRAEMTKWAEVVRTAGVKLD